jgi:hypothetical protein
LSTHFLVVLITRYLASTARGLTTHDSFYLFIPGDKCVIKARRKSKHVSAVASEFTWPDGRCTNVKLFMLKGAPLSLGQYHDGDVLPWVGCAPIGMPDGNDGALLDDFHAI